MDSIWISWNDHRRTETLVDFIGVDYVCLKSSGNRLKRYIVNSYKTLKLISNRRPKLLIVQNPSLFLALIASLVKNIYGYSLIVDTHNCGILPEKSVLKKIFFLNKYVYKRSEYTLVTNEALALVVKENGGTPFILPDKLPVINNLKKNILKGGYNIVFICTYGIDEPVLPFLEATKFLPNDVYVYVTGRKPSNFSHIDSIKYPNVIFTGFLDNEDYWNLLFSADLIADLTFREHCLVCGAYEAISLNKPLLLSDKKALVEYFGDGAIYTDNTSGDIAAKIGQAINDMTKMSNLSDSVKARIDTNWSDMGEELRNNINSLMEN